MILNLQKIEKLINSELSSKIKNSSIENEELLIETDENDLIDVVQFLKSNESCKFKQLIDIAGAMDDYETVTGFTVTPVIGFVQPTFELEIDRNEVDDAFEVPLDFLMDPGNHQLQSRIHKGHERHFYAVPYENRYIWGATAAMLVRFSQLITKA